MGASREYSGRRSQALQGAVEGIEEEEPSQEANAAADAKVMRLLLLPAFVALGLV